MGPGADSSTADNSTIINEHETIGEHIEAAASAVGEKAVIASLQGLSGVVVECTSSVPSEEQTSQYLEKVALIKKSNEEMNQLNILDEIIDLTADGKIGQAELETEIPDSIVSAIHEGDFMTEYIHSSITKKWVMNRFQEDSDKFEVAIRSNTLVEVIDKSNNTFDLFGLFIRYSATNRRNRIQPEFIAKGEPVCAKPRQIGNYAAFRGSQAVKRPLIPVLPKVQPPEPKVSKI